MPMMTLFDRREDAEGLGEPEVVPLGSGVPTEYAGVLVVSCVGNEAAVLLVEADMEAVMVLVGIFEVEEVMVWSGVLVGTAVNSEVASLGNTRFSLARTLEQKAGTLLFCDCISLFSCC